MAVAGGPCVRNWGIKVVRVNVRAWKSEKIAYGTRATADRGGEHEADSVISGWRVRTGDWLGRPPEQSKQEILHILRIGYERA